MSDKLPARLREPFLDIENEVIWLHATWKMFRDLFGHNEQRIKLLNHTDEFFFGTLQRVLLDDVILGLTRLVDRRHDTLDLSVLINSLESGKHPSLETQLAAAFSLVQSAVKKFVKIRDGRLAHRSKKVATLGEDSVLPGISRADIERALLEVRNFLNAISLYFNETTTDYQTVLSHSDGDSLLYALRKAAGFDLAVTQGKLDPQFWEETEFGAD